MTVRLHQLLLPGTLLLIANAQAQTMFIPDVNLRGWLNAAKPGSVDVNGNCDTAAWNAVPPSYVAMSFGTLTPGSTVDLQGIQYLKMNTLNWGGGTNIAVLWPGHPRANQTMMVTGVNVNDVAGFLSFPSTLGVFNCFSCGLTDIPTSFVGTGFSCFDVDFGGQVPYIPSTLTGLNLTRCNISSLPALPNLNSLDLVGDSLDAYPALPASLNNLYLEECGIPTIPPLPSGLSNFNFLNNGATTVPALPAGMSMVDLSDNNITTLPALPPNLWRLEVNHNPLTAFPDLPNNIYYLSCDSCPLTTIDALPAELEYASLEATSLTSLPELPGILETLRLKGCDQLTCLPVLPQSLQTLRLYGTGVGCLPNIPPDLNTTGGQNNLGIAATLCGVSNSPCPILDLLVTGTVFNDANANGVFDGGEIVRPNAVIEAQPGNFLTGSNWNGEYVLPMDTGSFSVDGQPTLYEGTTTAPYAVTFNSIGEVDSLDHIGYEVVPGIFDLVTRLEVTPTRPGFHTTMWLTVHNAGTEPTNASVLHEFDSQLEYVGSDYAPDAVNDETITWTTGVLYPGASWQVEITFYLPPTVPLGTSLFHQATGSPDQADVTPGDNVNSLLDAVVGSYDPNDKRVEPTVLSPQQVAMGEEVTWTVRFQNTGTFPAERVLITDTLSDDLRWNTIQVLAASHAHTWYIQHGVLHLLFENINLPDSTNDEPGSHGFVKFIMKPLTTLTDGAQVFNTANIYFDFNEPVITNEAVLTVDIETSVAAGEVENWIIWPNPTADVLRITCPASLIGSVEVIDVTGKTLRRSQLGASITELDVRMLSPGTYFLRITSATGSHTTTFSKH